MAHAALFAPLRVHGAHVLDTPGASLDTLQRALAARAAPITTHGGAPLRFVPQGGKPNRFEERYEPRIYLKGEMQVSVATPHDVMNALAWLAFPRAKAALNARHYGAQLRRQADDTPNRAPEQDALTLFDEGGVVVASGDEHLLALLRDFQWKELFWRNRERVVAAMRFFLFGHALYEKAMRPFAGISGRALLLGVDGAFLSASLTDQVDAVDRRVAAHLMDEAHLQTTRELAPVPVLGVPGWWPANNAEAFYDNAQVFRPGRRAAARGA
jgi:Protein of unknown function (DUF3025)